MGHPVDSGYALKHFGSFACDPSHAAYAEAIAASVRAGDVVLDLGAGIGLHGLLACKAGAKRVYAIEVSPTIQLARELARDNGFAERIVFIEDASTAVRLDERVDVIVSDLHGVLPLYQHALPSIYDARERFLKPNGRLIPQRERIWVVPIDAEQVYQAHLAPWNRGLHELNVDAPRRWRCNQWSRATRPVQPEQLLAGARLWLSIDYEGMSQTSFQQEMVFEVARRGTAHGYAIWFDSDLAANIQLHNGPGCEPRMMYGIAFLPLERPVPVSASDSVQIDLGATLTGNDYVWRWVTRVVRQQRAVACFEQSSFFGLALTRAQLAKRAPSGSQC